MNSKLLLHPSKSLVNIERRLFMKKTLSLGSLAMLTGCDPTEPSVTDRILSAMSRWNDEVQLAIFNPNKPAPLYTETDITEDFPFNGYYPESKAPVVAEEGFKLELSGLIGKKESWTLEQLRALPQESQITRHICVEGWSAIGKWGGVRFSEFLRLIEADTRQVCGLQVRRQISFKHRHGHRSSSANHPCAHLPRPGAADQVRLPDEAPRADEIGLQESQAHHGHVCDQ